jgi:hypothetical protein
MDSHKLKLIVVAVLSLFAALYLGVAVATAQMEAVAWVLGGLVLVACVGLGRRVWLLIPFLGAVGLSVRLPGLPSTLLMGQVLALTFSALIFLSRRLPYRLRMTELEFWMLALSVMVLQVYLRNPAGLWIFSTDTVGAKAYFLYAVSLAAAILLAGVLATPADLKAVIRLSIIAGLLNLCVSAVGRFVPTVGYWLGTQYELGSSNNDVETGEATRELTLAVFGKNLSLWISAFVSPLKAMLHPLWGPLVVVSVLAAGLSGFRNAIAAVGLTYLVGLVYRSGWISVWISAFGGIVALCLLSLANVVHPLPPNLQRSLSFLPGTWEKRYVRDGQNSTEWRLEIWREVLLSDRWIRNKVVGDGLGFTRRELEYQAGVVDRNLVGTGRSGFDFQRESILASGDYHSGPVTTIRVIGYAGLAVLLLFQIRLAVHAHRQIRRCRGTEWYPLALLVGVPLVWNPVFFVLIMGTFQSGSIMVLMGAGMIRLLENNLPLPAFQPGRIAQSNASAVASPLRAG